MIRKLCVFVLALVLVLVILQTVNAGSLTPSTSPAGTMYTTEQVYNPLVLTSYDSSAIASSSTGSAIQIARCVIEKMHGGSC